MGKDDDRTMGKDSDYGPIINLRGGLRVPLKAIKMYHEVITVSVEGDEVVSVIIYTPWGQAKVVDEVDDVIKLLDTHHDCIFEDL